MFLNDTFFSLGTSPEQTKPPASKIYGLATLGEGTSKDKAPYMEELEFQMQKLHEERAAAIVERRTADGNDEMKEIEAAVNAAMSVISRGGNSASMLDAATIAAQAASASRESRNLPVKLDEFGRDENLQKRMDMTRRAEAGRRRKA